MQTGNEKQQLEREFGRRKEKNKRRNVLRRDELPIAMQDETLEEKTFSIRIFPHRISFSTNREDIKQNTYCTHFFLNSQKLRRRHS